jgi:hypothetical protein
MLGGLLGGGGGTVMGLEAMRLTMLGGLLGGGGGTVMGLEATSLTTLGGLLGGGGGTVMGLEAMRLTMLGGLPGVGGIVIGLATAKTVLAAKMAERKSERALLTCTVMDSSLLWNSSYKKTNPNEVVRIQHKLLL